MCSHRLHSIRGRQHRHFLLLLLPVRARVSQKPMDSDCRLGGVQDHRSLASTQASHLYPGSAMHTQLQRGLEPHVAYGTASDEAYLAIGFLVFVSSEKMNRSAAFVVRHFDIQILYRSNIYFCCYGHNFIVSN